MNAPPCLLLLAALGCSKAPAAEGPTSPEGSTAQPSSERASAAPASSAPPSSEASPEPQGGLGLTGVAPDEDESKVQEKKVRLDPKVIQGVVRSHYDEFRKCYEGGLAKDPKLEGRLVVRFRIGLDGNMERLDLLETSIPDEEVVQCIVGHFGQLTFPQPNGGTVDVTYPLKFAPE